MSNRHKGTDVKPFEYIVIEDCDLEKFMKQVKDAMNRIETAGYDLQLVGPMIPCTRVAMVDGVLMSTIWYYQTIWMVRREGK